MQRFYKKVSVEFKDNLYIFFLDGMAIKTPKKNILSTISHNKAKIVSQEWEDQAEKIDPTTMPFTKYLNNIHDQIIPARKNIIDHLGQYIETDTIFYLTDDIHSELYQEQTKYWLPIIEFFNIYFQADLHYGASLKLPAQPLILHQKIQLILQEMSAEDFAAFYTIISILGSHLLALYAYLGHISYQDAFDYAFLEEKSNAKKWGSDPDMQFNSKKIISEYNNAVAFLSNP